MMQKVQGLSGPWLSHMTNKLKLCTAESEPPFKVALSLLYRILIFNFAESFILVF